MTALLLAAAPGALLLAGAAHRAAAHRRVAARRAAVRRDLEHVEPFARAMSAIAPKRRTS